jgi:hypothetical protein
MSLLDTGKGSTATTTITPRLGALIIVLIIIVISSSTIIHHSSRV